MLTVSRRSLPATWSLPKSSPKESQSCRGKAYQSSVRKSCIIFKEDVMVQNKINVIKKLQQLGAVNNSYPFNHDIFYNWNSRFEADFIKIPRSVGKNCTSAC